MRRAVDGEVDEVEADVLALALAAAELLGEVVLSLRCLSQKANAGFFLLAWLTGSSMAASVHTTQGG